LADPTRRHGLRAARSGRECLGLRPRRTARTGAAALIPSERRVADLAADGLSNPKTAHQLRTTRKTVESHLARVYRKLSIPGRDELKVYWPTAISETLEVELLCRLVKLRSAHAFVRRGVHILR